MRLPLLNSAWNPAFWKTCFKSDSFGSLKNIALCGGILLVGNLLREGTWPAARAASLLATIQKDMCNVKGVLNVEVSCIVLLYQAKQQDRTTTITLINFIFAG